MGAGSLHSVITLGGPITAALLFAALISVAAVLTAFIPLRVGVWVGSLLSTIQLYTFPLGTFYASLAMIGWMSAWRSATRLGQGLWRWPWMKALLAVLLAQIVSLIWSPDLALGFRNIVYTMPLILAAHAAYSLSLKNPGFVSKCLAAIFLGSTLEAVLVIAFRVYPSIELSFLHGKLARLFISGNVLDLLFMPGGGNNVLDPDKAGGVFVNANVASAYLGVCAFGAWHSNCAGLSRILRLAAVLDWTAVFFTGSKAGIILAVALPVIFIGVHIVRTRTISPVVAVCAPLIIGAATVLVAITIDVLARFQHASLATLTTRRAIWHFAFLMMHQHPILGLGFGGWEERFPLYAGTYGISVYPPHNSLLIAWTQCGLAGLVAGLLFISCTYSAIIRGLRLCGRDASFALGIAAAFSWYILQGMGENLGLTGEIHLTPILGLSLGYLCARCDISEAVNGKLSEPMRGFAAPSALSPV